MLAKLTTKNQITIPKEIINRLPKAEYFEVELQDEVIALRPVQIISHTTLKSIQAKMLKMGLNETAVAEAVRWAREKP